MEPRADLAETRSLLSRMVEAITAADTQTPWPADELAALADEVWSDGGTSKVWALS